MLAAVVVVIDTAVGAVVAGIVAGMVVGAVGAVGAVGTAAEVPVNFVHTKLRSMGWMFS